MFEMDWQALIDSRDVLLSGMLITLQITAVAILFGLAWGTVLAIFSLSTHRALRVFTQAYVSLFRSIPLVMLLLWDQDGRSVNEIAHPLHLDSGTLTPLLKRMEKAGLLTRGRDAKDERIVRVHLTPQGKSLREKARAIPQAILCASGMELDGLMALREEVKALGQSLREK